MPFESRIEKYSAIVMIKLTLYSKLSGQSKKNHRQRIMEFLRQHFNLNSWNGCQEAKLDGAKNLENFGSSSEIEIPSSSTFPRSSDAKETISTLYTTIMAIGSQKPTP